jgi:hypothetical protein
VAAQFRAQQALTAAEIAHDSAASSLQSVEGGSSSQGSAISSTDASRLSRRQRFLSIVIPTVLIATLLATVLVVLLEVVPARPSSRWAQLKRRLPPDDPSSAAVSRLQAKAARRRRSEVPGGLASTLASEGFPEEDAGVPAHQSTQPTGLRPSEPDARGTVAVPAPPVPRARPEDGSRRLRLRMDPAEEALAVEEGRAAQEALAARQARAAQEARNPQESRNLQESRNPQESREAREKRKREARFRARAERARAEETRTSDETRAETAGQAEPPTMSP